MKDGLIGLLFICCCLLWFKTEDNATSFVKNSESVVVLTKGGTNIENFVSVFSSKYKGLDLAQSNCEQVLGMYQKFYTNGSDFICYRVK